MVLGSFQIRGLLLWHMVRQGTEGRYGRNKTSVWKICVLFVQYMGQGPTVLAAGA